jgi:hypothetical protein
LNRARGSRHRDDLLLHPDDVLRDAAMRYGSSDDAATARGRDRAHLTQFELAERWRLSGRTLEKWRQTGRGPRWLRVGGRVLYPADEVERFEAANLRGGR